MDSTEWIADGYYGQRWEVWAEVEPSWAMGWFSQHLADLVPWQCATSAQGDDTMIEASLAGIEGPALRLRVAPLGRGTVVEALCLAHESFAFHDFVMLCELATRLPGAKVLQGPFVPEEEPEPEPQKQPEGAVDEPAGEAAPRQAELAASRKGGRPRKTELTEEERRAAERYQEAVAKGTPKRVAAKLQGHDYKTLERWGDLLGG